jgi:ribonuclease J
VYSDDRLTGRTDGRVVESGAHQNRFVELREGDAVILSSTPIPGNEGAILKSLTRCVCRARTFIARHIIMFMSRARQPGRFECCSVLCRPRFPVPYHGEARHAVAYADMCEEIGYKRENMPFMQIGDVLSVTPDKCEITGQVTAGSVLVDGLTIGDVGYSVLRDRRHWPDDGVVVVTVILDKQTATFWTAPIYTAWFLHQPNNEEFLTRATQRVREKLEGMKHAPLGDEQGISRIIRETLADFIWSTVRRKPMILPS